ncbi:hypothetical protein RYX36_014405 [Vicia faba]
MFVLLLRMRLLRGWGLRCNLSRNEYVDDLNSIMKKKKKRNTTAIRVSLGLHVNCLLDCILEIPTENMPPDSCAIIISVLFEWELEHICVTGGVGNWKCKFSIQ